MSGCFTNREKRTDRQHHEGAGNFLGRSPTNARAQQQSQKCAKDTSDIMKIIFVDAKGRPVQEVLVVGRDHWDACEIGHSILGSNHIPGAEDFQVEPLQNDYPETKPNVNLHGSAASAQRTA